MPKAKAPKAKTKAKASKSKAPSKAKVKSKAKSNVASKAKVKSKAKSKDKALKVEDTLDFIRKEDWMDEGPLKVFAAYISKTTDFDVVKSLKDFRDAHIRYLSAKVNGNPYYQIGYIGGDPDKLYDSEDNDEDSEDDDILDLEAEFKRLKKYKVLRYYENDPAEFKDLEGDLILTDLKLTKTKPKGFKRTKVGLTNIIINIDTD